MTEEQSEMDGLALAVREIERFFGADHVPPGLMDKILRRVQELVVDRTDRLFGMPDIEDVTEDLE